MDDFIKRKRERILSDEVKETYQKDKLNVFKELSKTDFHMRFSLIPKTRVLEEKNQKYTKDITYSEMNTKKALKNKKTMSKFKKRFKERFESDYDHIHTKVIFSDNRISKLKMNI